MDNGGVTGFVSVKKPPPQIAHFFSMTFFSKLIRVNIRINPEKNE